MEYEVDIYLPRQDISARRRLKARAEIETPQVKWSGRIKGKLLGLPKEDLHGLFVMVCPNSGVVLFIENRRYEVASLESDGIFEAIEYAP